jgi:transcriptional regulator with XRE-family HTH domain
MDVRSTGRVIAHYRRARGLSLRELATAASVGRSTLAALESGKLDEIGFAKVERICAALGLTLEVREPVLEAPLMEHRHLTERAGRELTKAAIEDVITRGEIEAWRGLVKAIRDDPTGRIARRAREVSAALSGQDSRARAFAALLPYFAREAEANGSDRR